MLAQLSAWGGNISRPVWVSALVGVLIGAAISWWINSPIPPWIEIDEVSATYVRGSRLVNVAGEYTARRTCSREEQGTLSKSPEPLLWRQEVQGTGPEIVQYAQRPDPPVLQIGTHPFVTDLPLDEGIDPDGWRISVIVSCDTEPYAVRSKSVEVEYLPASTR